MTTAKEKAEAYVRQKLNLSKDEPLALQHWLRVLLPEPIDKHVARELTVQPFGKCVYHEVDHVAMTAKTIRIHFNLTTGHPATEADYQTFNDIVGV